MPEPDAEEFQIRVLVTGDRSRFASLLPSLVERIRRDLVDEAVMAFMAQQGGEAVTGIERVFVYEVRQVADPLGNVVDASSESVVVPAPPAPALTAVVTEGNRKTEGNRRGGLWSRR